MLEGVRGGFLALCVVAIAALPAHADERTFTALLAQAKAQAAAGHRWAPPGNNMTETVLSMMDLIPAATPAELAQLSALLESEKAVSSPTPAASDPVTHTQPTQSGLLPPPQPMSTMRSSAPEAPTEPAGRLEPAGAPQGGDGKGGSGALVPSQVGPSLIEPNHRGSDQARSGQTESDQVGRNQATASLIDPEQTGQSQLGPSQITPGLINRSQIRPDRTGSVMNGAEPPLASPAGRAGVLFARGMDAEIRGDFSAARRFYLSSAQQGSAAAARNLGRLYDPSYLKQATLGGVDADPALARHWYEQAVKLGDAQAGPLLEALSAR